MKYFDAFSGIRGFTKGIRSVGPDAECVGHSETDKYASAISQYHYPNHKNYGDITAIDARKLPDFDLFVGGFPCQAFSIAGKRQGFKDTRGTLFFDVARICKAKKPEWILLENVKNLCSHDSGKTLATIYGVLTDIGYTVGWQVVNSCQFGVPQSRERIFIVGHLTEAGGRAGEILPVRKAGSPPDKKQYTSTAIDCNYWKGIDNHGQRTGIIINGKIRLLIPIECERLQGFPDGWTEKGIMDGEEVEISDTQRYKCLGNAVTVNVIEVLYSKISHLINAHHENSHHRRIEH